MIGCGVRISKSGFQGASATSSRTLDPHGGARRSTPPSVWHYGPTLLGPRSGLGPVIGSLRPPARTDYAHTLTGDGWAMGRVAGRVLRIHEVQTPSQPGWPLTVTT